MDNITVLVGRLLERRESGDTRLLAVLANELTADIPVAELRDIVAQTLTGSYLRKARGLAFPDDDSDKEFTLETQFELFPGATGRYRTAPLVRVIRDGRTDFVPPTHPLTGAEIERADTYEEQLRKRQLVKVTQRKADNLEHSRELVAIGFDPKTQFVADMHCPNDPRRCVLCGEGARVGDPWTRDHEIPVSAGNGRTRIGWAHRSCNSSKGAVPLTHVEVGA